MRRLEWMSDRSRNFLEWREIDTNWILFLLLLDFFQILIELCGLIVVKGLNWMDVEKPENPRNMPVLQEEEKFCYQRYPFISSTCLSLVTGMSILKIRKILQKIWILHSGLKANFKRFWKKNIFEMKWNQRKIRIFAPKIKCEIQLIFLEMNSTTKN